MTPKFEIRLAQECGVLRAEMHSGMQGLRDEMCQLRTEFRTDLRVEIANARAEAIKWSFLFWIGQMAAVSGLMTLLR